MCVQKFMYVHLILQNIMLGMKSITPDDWSELGVTYAFRCSFRWNPVPVVLYLVRSITRVIMQKATRYDQPARMCVCSVYCSRWWPFKCNRDFNCISVLLIMQSTGARALGRINEEKRKQETATWSSGLGQVCWLYKTCRGASLDKLVSWSLVHYSWTTWLEKLELHVGLGREEGVKPGLC